MTGRFKEKGQLNLNPLVLFTTPVIRSSEADLLIDLSLSLSLCNNSCSVKKKNSLYIYILMDIELNHKEILPRPDLT